MQCIKAKKKKKKISKISYKCISQNTTFKQYLSLNPYVILKKVKRQAGIL